GPAAVDGNRGTGDSRSGVGGEIRGERGQVLEPDELLRRLVREDDLAHDILLRNAVHLRLVVDLVLDDRRQRIPGTDRIRRDAHLRDLEGDRLGEADEAVV